MDVSRIRKDFPVLQQKLKGRPLIYFDNACMALKPRQVIEKQNEYYEKYSACAGRSVHSLSRRVEELCQETRKKVSRFLGAKKSEEIVFTKNTTEGINLLARSLDLKKGDKVLTSDREHNSNHIPWLLLRERGIEHDVVESNPDNTFDPELFQDKLDKNVKVVSIVHTSNLDGYTLPVKEIASIAHDNGSLVIVDGAQSAPHQEIDVRKLGADFFACSGHKMCGPTGTGILYGRSELLENLKPFMVGGETVINSEYTDFKLEKVPERFEAGLQNYGGIIGLGAAVDYLKKTGPSSIAKHEHELNKTITEGLKEIPDLFIIGPPDPKLRGGVVSFYMKGLEAHDIAIILDDTSNIMVRSGMFCVHSWFNYREVPGSVRASLYLYNTKEEAQVFVEKVKETAKLG